MSHVLLSGDPGRYPGLRTLLRGWGATVSDRPADSSVAADLGACDLVIHVATEGVRPGAMPDGTQEAGGAAPAAAPLLVLGWTGPVAGAWEVVPDPGPRGLLLRAAVARAEERARELRGRGRRPGRAEYRQYLGHELRSPLAAIKTAVDVLRGEARPSVGPHRMADLAARNVARLAAAVECAEDLLELMDEPPVPRPREIDLAALAVRLESEERPVRVRGDGGTRVLTDPSLLARVVGRLERAVRIVHPDGGVDVVLDAGDGEGAVRLHLTTEAAARPVPGLQAGGPGPELDRLARILCPPDLLAGLGLEPVSGPPPGARAGMTLTLPAAAGLPVP